MSTISSGRLAVGKNCFCARVKAPIEATKASAVMAIVVLRQVTHHTTSRRNIRRVGRRRGRGAPWLRQQVVAHPGREQHGHEPRDDQREADHPEVELVYSPALDRAKPTGTKPIAVTRCRSASGRQSRCRRRSRPRAGWHLLELHHHHLDGDDGVVDQQAQRNDQRRARSSGSQCRAACADESDGQHSGTDIATMTPVRTPRLMGDTISTMASASRARR